MYNKLKELHVWLDTKGMTECNIMETVETVKDTIYCIDNNHSGIVHTTQPIFLNYDIAEELYIHCNGEEIHLNYKENRGDEFNNFYTKWITTVIGSMYANNFCNMSDYNTMIEMLKCMNPSNTDKNEN